MGGQIDKGRHTGLCNYSAQPMKATCIPGTLCLDSNTSQGLAVNLQGLEVETAILAGLSPGPFPGKASLVGCSLVL